MSRVVRGACLLLGMAFPAFANAGRHDLTFDARAKITVGYTQHGLRLETEDWILTGSGARLRFRSKGRDESQELILKVDHLNGVVIATCVRADGQVKIVSGAELIVGGDGLGNIVVRARHRPR